MIFEMNDLSISEIFELLPDAVCVINVIGNILLSNREFDKKIITKSRRSSVSFIDDLVHEEDKASFLETVQLSADGKTKNTTGPIRTLTSEQSGDFPVYRRYLWSISCATDHNRLILCGRVVNAIESQDKSGVDLIDFFQYAPTRLHWISQAGIVLWANNVELESLGYSAEEYIGQRLSKFCLPEDTVSVDAVFSSQTTVDSDVPLRLVSKNGDLKRRLLSSTKVAGRSLRYYFVSEKEGSPSHSQSEAITAADKEAVLRVSLAKDLCMLDAFADIRTHMKAISELSMQLPKSCAEQTHLQLHVQYVLGVVEDMSFVARCDGGKVLTVRPSPVHLETLIRDVYNNLTSFRFGQKHAGAGMGSPPPEMELSIRGVPEGLSADASLARVFYHLLSNSLAHGLSNSAVKLSVSFAAANSSPDGRLSPPVKTSGLRAGRSFRAGAATRRGVLEVRVTNSVAAAMDLEAVHAAFQRYYSSQLAQTLGLPAGSSTSGTSSKGLGIGLNVAYNVVQMMGGVLECSTSPSESSFWFSLELGIGPPPKPPQRHALAQAQGTSSDGVGASVSPSVSLADMQEWTPLHESSVANQFILDELGVGYVSPTEYSRKITLSASVSSRSAGPTGADPEAVLGPTRRTRILVVDDNTICQKVLVNTLKRIGMDSDVAWNGKEAVEKLTAVPLLFDAVLMDLYMPIMDGLTATRTCRALHIALPIIVLTADVGTDGRAENAIQAGVDVFLSKPVSVNTLRDVLKQFNLV